MLPSHSSCCCLIYIWRKSSLPWLLPVFNFFCSEGNAHFPVMVSLLITSGPSSWPLNAYVAALADHWVVDNGQILSLGWEDTVVCNPWQCDWPDVHSDSGSPRSSVPERLRGSIKFVEWSSQIVWKWRLYSSHTVSNLIVCLLCFSEIWRRKLMGDASAKDPLGGAVVL